MPPNTFTVIPTPSFSAYRDRIVVNTNNESLKKRLDMLSMWGGSDKVIFNCSSWEMGPEELVVAIKWCKMSFLTNVPIEKAS